MTVVHVSSKVECLLLNLTLAPTAPQYVEMGTLFFSGTGEGKVVRYNADHIILLCAVLEKLGHKNHIHSAICSLMFLC